MKLPTSYRAQLGDAANFLLDFDWLNQHYTVLKLTTRQIGVIVGCGKKAVTTALKRHNIPLITNCRNQLAANVVNFTRQVTPAAIGKLNNKEWMARNFISLNRSEVEIAEECGVSVVSIRNWARKHGLRKTSILMSECSKRRYQELNGYSVGSEAACRKRMGGHRCSVVKTQKGGAIQCHSSWEATFALALDKSPFVRCFQKDAIKIPYDFQGKAHHYFPDFLIYTHNGGTWLVEIKAFRLLKDDRVKAKLVALESHAKQFGFLSFVLSGKTKIDPQSFLSMLESQDNRI